MFPALVGRFLTTGPPGKSSSFFFFLVLKYIYFFNKMTGEYRVTWFCEFLLKCSYEATLKVSSLYYFCLFCCCVILLVHELYV